MTNEDGYIGCYRIIDMDITDKAIIKNNTIDACKRKCFVEYKRSYAGASNDVCYCSYDDLSTLVKNEVVCDTLCPGKPTVNCGGDNTISFYNATFTEKSTTASPSTTQTITSSMTNDSNVTTDYINSTDVTSNSTTSQHPKYFDYDLMFPVLLVVGVLVLVIIGTMVAVLVRHLYHKRTKRQNAELDEDNDEHRGNVSPGEYDNFYAGGPGDIDTEYDTTAARPVQQSHVEGHVYSRYNVHRGHSEDPDYSHIRGYQFGASAVSQDEYSHIGDMRGRQLNVGADCYDRVDMSDRQGVKWSNKTYQPACDSGNDVYDHVQYNV